MKTVSQLDASGYYVGPTIADESPLDPGVFIIPGNAIDIPIPDIPQGQRAKWQDGWIFDAIPQSYPDLEQEPIQARPKQFTSLEYLELFTEDEQIAVVSATMVTPQIKLWYDKMLAAGYVTIGDPRTEAGLTALVQAGLLQAERKSAILAQM